jgi:hypothetical protein
MPAIDAVRRDKSNIVFLRRGLSVIAIHTVLIGDVGNDWPRDFCPFFDRFFRRGCELDFYAHLIGVPIMMGNFFA